jgi:hypothetical protein
MSRCNVEHICSELAEVKRDRERVAIVERFLLGRKRELRSPVRTIDPGMEIV